MVTSPTGKGVIVMGGYSSGGRSKAMFELTQSMQWTRLEQTLQIEHNGGQLAIPIPDELVCEKKWIKKQMKKVTVKINITDVSKKDIFLVPFLLLNFTKSSICLKYILGKSIFVLFSY